MLALQALSSFTTANPTGIFGTADNPAHLDQLLLALQMSTPTKHQSDAIHRSINEKLAWIESKSLAQALTQGTDVLTPSSIADPSVATRIVPPQSSLGPQSSLKRSREAAPLDLLPIKETRITQFNVATQSVPASRLSHQRQVKGTSFFGDLIQAHSVQHLATSSLVGLSQPRSRGHSSGLATSTRPGRSGEDKGKISLLYTCFSQVIQGQRHFSPVIQSQRHLSSSTTVEACRSARGA